MKQTLSEIAAILLEIERGKPWQYKQDDGVWSSPATQGLSPVTMVAGGYYIRLKPAELDPHPNRAEVEEGIKQGRKWQIRRKDSDNKTWIDAYQAPGPRWLPEYDYRLEPEPEYIPLGQKDVPPGSVIRINDNEQIRTDWLTVLYSRQSGVGYPEVRSNAWLSWQELFDGWQINRSLPLTGKWDPNAWEPCRKLKGGDNE